jgi:hypothetical protein
MAQSPSNVINDAHFSRMTDIQAFALDAAGGTELILGKTSSYSDNASKAGIHTIIGGAGGHDTIDASNFAPITPWLVGGKVTPWDLAIVVNNATTLATDSIVGNALTSSPILEISDPYQTISDALLGGNISGISQLNLDSLPSDSLSHSNVTLGANAQAEGIVKFNGGSGYGNLTISTGSYLAATTLTGGTGVNTSLKNFNVLTIANDLQTIADAAFKNVSNFQTLQLSQSPTAVGSSVTLDKNALATGFSTITGGFGSDTVTQNTGDTAGLFIDLSNGNGGMIALANSGLLSSDTLLGNAGTTTLSLTTNGQYVVDTQFANSKNLSIVSLTGGNDSIVLGTNAVTAGVHEVHISPNAANHGNTIDASATTSAMTLDAGGVLNNAPNSGFKDIMISGTGADSFVLASGGATGRTYYATSQPALVNNGADIFGSNYAEIIGFSSKDSLVLHHGDTYTIGLLANLSPSDPLGTGLSNNFGLYDGNKLVADINTDGNFSQDMTAGVLNVGAAGTSGTWGTGPHALHYTSV